MNWKVYPIAPVAAAVWQVQGTRPGLTGSAGRFGLTRLARKAIERL